MEIWYQAWVRPAFLLLSVLGLAACSPSESPGDSANTDVAASAGPAPEAVGQLGQTYSEEDIERYIRLFPYQDTYDYAVRYTGSDPENLNGWAIGAEPTLIKAGEDRIVRMNNDTFYKMAMVYLEEGEAAYLSAETPDESRFVSFQLMDDRNVNYHNVIYPDGDFTLYFGDAPDEVRGESIQVPSALSVVIVRVEVKDADDAQDIAAAEAIFNTITIEGSLPEAFPVVDVLSGFSEAVVEEGNRRLDETFSTTPFSLLVAGPGEEPGGDVPYLYHSAGTKGGWGGPGTAHSAYETFFDGADGQPLIGSNGTYVVTTEEPPVDAFWSVTVYDTERGGFFHPNDDDRYHINDTTAAKNEDGSVTFQFKQVCEAEDVNCLAVPAGRFDIATRYYLPREAIRSGEWVFPAPALAE